MNSGGIRNSIEIGNISFSDMMGMMPFSNTIDLVTLKGSDLMLVFEASAKGLSIVTNPDGTLSVDGNGGFLQVSGVCIIFKFHTMVKKYKSLIPNSELMQYTLFRNSYHHRFDKTSWI